MERFAAPDPGAHPPLAWPAYRSTLLRAPGRPLVPLAHTLTELTGPVFGDSAVQPGDADLTRQHRGEHDDVPTVEQNPKHHRRSRGARGGRLVKIAVVRNFELAAARCFHSRWLADEGRLWRHGHYPSKV